MDIGSSKFLIEWKKLLFLPVQNMCNNDPLALGCSKGYLLGKLRLVPHVEKFFKLCFDEWWYLMEIVALFTGSTSENLINYIRFKLGQRYFFDYVKLACNIPEWDTY